MCAALSASRSSRAAVFADWRAARLSLGCPAFSTFLSPYDLLPCAVVDRVGLGAGMSEPRQQRVSVNGVSLCYFEWGERVAGAPSTLLVHATGFHGRLWDQSVKQFSGPVAGHIVAIDMRGHGRSDKSHHSIGILLAVMWLHSWNPSICKTSSRLAIPWVGIASCRLQRLCRRVSHGCC